MGRDFYEFRHKKNFENLKNLDKRTLACMDSREKVT